MASQLLTLGVALTAANDVANQIIAKATETAITSLTSNLNSVITATLDQFRKAQADSTKTSKPMIFGKDGDGDPKHCFSDWCVHVIKNDRSYLEKEYGSEFAPWQRAALGESSGTTGGYIVPPQFNDQIMAIAAENNTFRQNAFTQPMTGATLAFPYLDITTVRTAGQSPFFGGVVFNWTQEAQTRTETEPTFKMMESRPTSLAATRCLPTSCWPTILTAWKSSSTPSLARPSVGTKSLPTSRAPVPASRWACLNANATLAIPRDTASHFTFPDLAAMQSHLLPSSYGKAQWWISPTVVADLLQLKDYVGRAIFISIDMGATQPPVWKMLGMPVNITEKLPALGTAGDVLLADPRST